MKAVVASDYGPPESFTFADVETPIPGPGQIQVKVRAAALNPVDLKIAAGGIAELTFPHVLGNDFAGTVTAIAPGVTAFKNGDEVFGHAVPRALRAITGRGKPSLGTGTLAEFVVVEADTPFISHRPPSLPAVEAAALGTAGLTARALAITAAVTPGERVLVIGATGGVGTALLPLLSHAHVIATGHPADETLLRKLGATETMGYAEYPPNVDVALNLALPSDQLADVARVIRPGGRLFTITFPFPRQEWIGRDDVEFRLVLDSEGALGGAAELTGLRATIARTYALDEGPQAYRDLAHRHTVGKLVIEMG
ncbi:NADP-dependent oxidoreductase [Actinoplanes sp. CA-015351]|uniref:NADP-dependent oxidoreductase n=1 Tax=Actinoplanes sp. CA-015351 TaxID=3239897 RepID=UPI003D98CF2A